MHNLWLVLLSVLFLHSSQGLGTRSRRDYRHGRKHALQHNFLSPTQLGGVVHYQLTGRAEAAPPASTWEDVIVHIFLKGNVQGTLLKLRGFYFVEPAQAAQEVLEGHMTQSEMLKVWQPDIFLRPAAVEAHGSPVKLHIVPYYDPENKPRELHRPFEVAAELPATELDHTYTLHIWQWQRHATVHLSALVSSGVAPVAPAGPQVTTVISPFLEDRIDLAILLVARHIQYHTIVFGFVNCVW